MKKSISFKAVVSLCLSLYMLLGSSLSPSRASDSGARKAVAPPPSAGLKLPNAAPAGASGIVRFLRVPAPQSETRADGQSATLMPDGRWLLLGGKDGDGVLGAAHLKDARGGSVQQLSSGLQQPRAGHTATLLPDGTVLVLGGVGAGGEVLDSAELFHPETQQFEALSAHRFTPRAYHTATLLTDGDVLVAGGTGAAGEMHSRAELWDWKTRTARPVAGQVQSPRSRHTATLQPDGSVLLWGGFDRGGAGLDDGVLYEPKTGQLNWVGAFSNYEDENAPHLRASQPEDGSMDVPVDARIGLRFSKPLSVATVNARTVTLKGPEGVVEGRVTPAEGGMLAFIIPQTPLREGTTYTITLADAADESGRELSYAMLSFTTAGGESDRRPNDGEDWTPDARNMRGDWRSNRPESQWQKLPPLQAEAGVTALAGQVLLLNGNPLADVTLQIGTRAARTDNTGRFLLTDIPAGHQVMVMDGRTASKPKKVYGLFKIGVDVEAGKTTALPYTSWMPRLDTENVTTLSVPTSRQVAVTTPFIPGLEVRVPEGAVVRDTEGRTVTQLTITPIPVDRTPFPLPGGVSVPVFFTVQPGAARVIPPRAQVVYPNYGGYSPGARLDFWSYDPEHKGWYVYGQGTVTADGRQVMPDPGVVIYEFTGFMIGPPTHAPGTGPAAGSGGEGTDGDPVSLSTGLFVYDQTDLKLADTMPISVSRTYRQLDATSRSFGIGTTHLYDIFLVGDNNNYTYQELILPDGGRVRFNRISAGNQYRDAVYESLAPNAFHKARLTFNGPRFGWDLLLKNGTLYEFPGSLGVTRPTQTALKLVKDRHGNSVTLTRGQNSRLTRVTSTNGRWIDLTYDTSDRVTQAKDNIGRTVNYTYDVSGRLWKVTDPRGGVTEYTYNAAHQMLTVKDARGIIYLTNVYDANGRVSKQTQADSSTYLFAYTLDAAGKVTQTNVTDTRGNVRRVTFNAAGYTLTDTYALGKPEQQTATYERQAGTNLLLSITDTLNRKTTYTYDPMGNATEVTRLAGTADAVTLRFTYDPRFQQPATATDGLNHTTTFEYDAKGNLVGIVNPLNQRTTLAYNPAGQPVSITDTEQNTTQLRYVGGLLSGATDPLGRSFNRFIDDAGRMLSVTDPLGQSSRYEYDSLSRLTKSIDPLGATTSYTYDANGNLLTVTDGRNNTTTFVYDNMDRPTSRKDPLLRSETYQYDAAGNVIKFTDRRGKVTTYTYDARGRMTFVGYGAVGTNPTYESTITRTYDAGDRLTKVVDTKAGTVTYTHDGLDRILSEVTPQGTVSFTYDAAGRRTGMTASGQAAATYTYDDANRVTGVTQGTNSVGLSYDGSGRRSALTLPNGVVVEYGYSRAGQVTSLKFKRGAELLGDLVYEYDAAGRRVRVGGSYSATELPQSLTSATYNAANQLTQRGGVNLTYDANGNLTGDGTNTYTWDARNALVSIGGGTTATFLYDAFGRRVSKTVGGQATEYLYDGANAIQEKVGGSPSANILMGGIDEAFSRTTAAGTQSLLSDGLGTTLALLDAAGAELTRYTYAPFGAVAQSGGANSNPSKFTGREDDGTGLYYYRARYYSPQQQRFISGDPIGFASGVTNLYAYAGNSPTNYTDPSGLIIDTIIDIGSIVYDLVEVGTGGRKNLGDNLKNLGLDVGGALIPGVTGLGAMRRASQHADEVGDIARRASQCFVAGTLVQTEEGARPIEEIKEGDSVLSWNEGTGRVEYQRVTQTFVRRAEALVAVTIEGEGGAPLVTTEEHPFYIHRARDSLGGDEDAEGSWVAAGALRAGDYVRRPAGEWVRVLKVEARAEQATVYNFEVENNHNYFVGARGVLVHNSCSKRVRDQVFKDDPDCVWCKMPAARNGKAGHPDRWPVEGAHGGQYTIDNVVPSCPHCNMSRGIRDYPVTPPPDYPAGAPWPRPDIPTRP